MEVDGIVPDAIDQSPPGKLTITYGAKTVESGKQLTPTEVHKQPEIKWNADPKKYYLLAMIDLDVPSRAEPKSGEANHWLVGNILGSDLATGEVITEFIGSGPPKGSGFHRYVFLVYEQKEKLSFDEPRTKNNSIENRLNFSIRKFAQKYNLGQPMFGNYYQCQWDPYVEVLMKQFTH